MDGHKCLFVERASLQKATTCVASAAAADLWRDWGALPLRTNAKLPETSYVLSAE